MRTKQHFKEKATHWVATPDGYGGFTYKAPKVLNCRWEERADQFKTPGGQQVVSRAVVYVESDVGIEDYLFLGVSSLADPALEMGAQLVQQFEKTPDLRALDHLRKVYL